MKQLLIELIDPELIVPKFGPKHITGTMTFISSGNFEEYIDDDGSLLVGKFYHDVRGGKIKLIL